MEIVENKRMLDKVRALLAKAEASTFREEAEAFSAKAQELMARYAIERALVEGVETSGEPVTLEVSLVNPYVKAKFVLLAAVAGENRCEAVLSSGDGESIGIIVGFPSDVETVEVLFTSLMLQATRLMTAEGSVVDPWGTSRTRSFRNAFLYGFAGSIQQRFAANRLVAEAEVSERSTQALPVLLSRQDRVNDKLNELYPRLRAIRTSVSNGAGVAAGRRAGASADIGTSGLGGSRRALR